LSSPCCLAEFNDALIAFAGLNADAKATVNFDRKAAKRMQGMELLA
jgi:predicted nucleic-acid-binding protein